jgi:hypothetical protein
MSVAAVIQSVNSVPFLSSIDCHDVPSNACSTVSRLIASQPIAQIQVDRLLTVLYLRRQLKSVRRRSIRFAAIQPRSHAIHIDILALCFVVVSRHATGKPPWNAAAE